VGLVGQSVSEVTARVVLHTRVGVRGACQSTSGSIQRPKDTEAMLAVVVKPG
jgi:hypothetical protein